MAPSLSLGVGLTGVAALSKGGGAWRQAATRSQLMNSSNTTNKQIMSRTAHFARASINGAKLVFANWYMTGSHPVTETNAGADATLTASIEYDGVIYPVTFGGLSSGSIPAGGELESDFVAVSIPNGAMFHVRSYYTSSWGLVFFSKGNSSAGFDGSEFGVSGITDKTGGGSVASSTNIYGPIAILTRTNADAYLLIGDSRTYGQNDTVDATLDLGVLARGIGENHPYINMGAASDRIKQFLVGYTKRLRVGGAYCNKVICNLGINDIRNTAFTKAELETDIESIRALFAGKSFAYATINPTTTSTDSWATTTNQTVTARESVRTGINDDLRNGVINGIDAYYDIADITETARNSGIWKVGYTTDGLHETQSANLAIRDGIAWP